MPATRRGAEPTRGSPTASGPSSVRAAIPGLARLDPALVEPGMRRLAGDLASGSWHRRHSDILNPESYDAGYRLWLSPPQPGAGRGLRR